MLRERLVVQRQTKGRAGRFAFGCRGRGAVTVRHLDEPVIVQYRDALAWQRVLALAVRRRDPHRYEVLIMQGHWQSLQNMTWVPRSRIRAEDAVMDCVAGSA